MRELVFKNLTSEDKKRRDLYISEQFEKNGVKTVMRRHSVYIVGNTIKISNPQDLIQYQLKFQSDADKRHIFIIKRRDTKLKKDYFVCDIVGKFYSVVKDELFSIAFKHSFEVDFLGV